MEERGGGGGVEEWGGVVAQVGRIEHATFLLVATPPHRPRAEWQISLCNNYKSVEAQLRGKVKIFAQKRHIKKVNCIQPKIKR